jgi:hypothetical protein
MRIIRETFRVCDDRGRWIVEMVAHVKREGEIETTHCVPQEIELSDWPIDEMIRRLADYRKNGPDLPAFDKLLDDLFVDEG